MSGLFRNGTTPDFIHPKDTKKRQRDKQKFAQQSKTRVFAAALTMLGEEVIEVAGEPDLSFRYVAREIVPARAPDYRWPSKSKPPQVDLLLAHVDRTPIVAEAKIARDMDPFFALIQVLAMASQLATPAQLDRLRHEKNYPEAFDPKATKVDAYVVMAGTASGTWTNLKTFAESASELAEALMQCQPITDSIRRIAAVSIKLKPSSLYAFS